MSTSIGFHHVRGVRLATACRSNSFSLSLRITREVNGYDKKDDYTTITDDDVELTIFLTTETEFDLLLTTIPKAADFVDYDVRDAAEEAARERLDYERQREETEKHEQSFSEGYAAAREEGAP